MRLKYFSNLDVPLELFKKLSSVVVLDSKRTDHGLVYTSMINHLELLKSYVFMDSDKENTLQHLHKTRMVIETLKLLLTGTRPTDRLFLDTNPVQKTKSEEYENNSDRRLEDSSKFCRIFKSLDTDSLMVELLRSLLNIPAEYYHEYIDTVQVCLELLCIVTKNDKEFQVSCLIVYRRMMYLQQCRIDSCFRILIF